MDLRGLDNVQWRGFSDKEIQQLHQCRGGSNKKTGNEEIKVKVASSQRNGHNNDRLCVSMDSKTTDANQDVLKERVEEHVQPNLPEEDSNPVEEVHENEPKPTIEEYVRAVI